MNRYLLALAAMVGLAALAAAPLNLGQPPGDYTRAGGPDWSVERALTTGGTWYVVPYASDSATSTTTPALVGWNTMVTAAASHATTCCWAMTSTLSHGGTGNATWISDAWGADGPGACFLIPAAGQVRSVPIWPVVAARPGARAGVCSAPSAFQTSAANLVYPACRVAGDCVEAKSPVGTTCDTSPSTRRQQDSGAMLTCMSASNTVTLHVRTER